MLENLISLIFTVMASVVSRYICKWLDSEENK
ncbi:hypothetical protein SAMN04489866_10691 [Peptococcus niger]|uniref:Uncharacterized protein n=1 Tax=Peptococcus niger TaxID=2741 RepID=A0A1G6X9Z9_PEPNI|nr:hypothetical protein SAMN04489866_10691 [Peptococcus niger]